jgi:hypothetical protein
MTLLRMAKEDQWNAEASRLPSGIAYVKLIGLARWRYKGWRTAPEIFTEKRSISLDLSPRRP